MTAADDHHPDSLRRDIHIELQGCRSKAELLTRIAAAMDFPPWFGHNWDALADCLSDLSWLPASGYTVHFRNVEDLHAAAPEVFATLVEILQETAAFWADEGVDFRVRMGADHASGT